MKQLLTILFLFVCYLGYSQAPSTSGYLLTYPNGNVSIGTQANTAPLTIANFSTAFPAPQAGTIAHLVSSAASNGRISFDVYNSDNLFGAVYQGRRAAGTAALPTAALADYTLAVFSGDGYGDDSFSGVSLGAMAIKSTGTMTNASKPTYISFLTTPSGSTTAAERLRILSTGAMRLNNYGAGTFTGTPTYSLQVDASGNIIEGGLGGSATWGNITGTLSTQTDLQTALDGKQATGSYAVTTNNLSDLSNASTARSNLGLVIGTNVLAPNGNGSALTGLTATQVGLGNVTNESKATMFTSPTFTGTPVVPGYLPNTTTAGVGSSPTSSSTTTITHNLGRVPAIIRISGYGSFTSNAAATATTSSMGVFNSSGNFCVYQRYGAAITTTQAGLSSSAFAILLATGGGNYISGVIQNVTSTQFDIVWTETGTATAQVYMWEAQ